VITGIIQLPTLFFPLSYLKGQDTLKTLSHYQVFPACVFLGVADGAITLDFARLLPLIGIHNIGL